MPRNGYNNVSRNTLFHNTDNNIPDFSLEERIEMIAKYKDWHGDSYHYIDEETWLHAMYHLGAVIINNNQADGDFLVLDIENEVENLLLYAGKSYRSDSQPKITRDDLIGRYSKVKAYVAFEDSHATKNPFHAVFVIKVALDHIAPEKIHHCYERLLEASFRKSSARHVLTMSTHSQLASSDAALCILKCYIVNNPDLFPMIKQDKIQQLKLELILNHGLNIITGLYRQISADCITTLLAMFPRYEYSQNTNGDRSTQRFIK
jgi:hypothetical protein